jgi:hypothetical protein
LLNSERERERERQRETLYFDRYVIATCTLKPNAPYFVLICFLFLFSFF